MNKQIFLAIALLTAFFTNAQTAIGKKTVNGANTLLDFYDSLDNVKGIILPALSDAPTVGLVNGTFYFDVTDKKIKMRQNNSWVNLSNEGNISSLVLNTTDEVILGTESASIIGAKSTNANGVLVLESSNKAMILPKITNPESTVVNPYPGMMCYDLATKSLAVFDGDVWNYWKAE